MYSGIKVYKTTFAWTDNDNFSHKPDRTILTIQKIQTIFWKTLLWSQISTVKNHVVTTPSSSFHSDRCPCIQRTFSKNKATAEGAIIVFR